MDQALGLRKKTLSRDPWNDGRPLKASFKEATVRTFSVSSGKGGVGKSNVVVNLAVALDQLGRRVMILDADLGLANVDVLLGLTPALNISHVLNGSRRLEEVLVSGPGNIRIMPASSGVQQLTQLSQEQKILLVDLMDDLEANVDILLIDTGAGISDTVLYFNVAAQEKIVVVTPEPTSLTDAYAFIKVMFTRHGERSFRILANAVANEKEGHAVFRKLSRVADHFLDGISLDYLDSSGSQRPGSRSSTKSAFGSFSWGAGIACFHGYRPTSEPRSPDHAQRNDPVFLEATFASVTERRTL